MPATRDGKLWRSQFYYKDWQGVRRKKNKRGFKTKGEADEWERNFLQQQQKNLDISFENFVEIYFADMENRLRESTIINKRYVFEELQLMQYNIAEILKQFEEQEILLSDEGLEQMKNDCLDMLKAIIWMLDGAKYLWQGTEKSPDSGNC